MERYMDSWIDGKIETKSERERKRKEITNLK